MENRKEMKIAMTTFGFNVFFFVFASCALFDYVYVQTIQSKRFVFSKRSNVRAIRLLKFVLDKQACTKISHLSLVRAKNSVKKYPYKRCSLRLEPRPADTRKHESIIITPGNASLASLTR